MIVIKWLGIFILFSILGFISEAIFCSLINEKSNKGLRGPWCPMYGFAGLIMLEVLVPLKNNFIIVYGLGALLAATVEYTIGFLLEKIYKIRWWDYSNCKCNLNGRITLSTTLLFGVLALLLVYTFNPLINIFYEKIPSNILSVVVIILLCLYVVDAIISMIEAFGLSKRIAIIRSNKIYNLKTETEKKENLKYYFDKLRFAFNPKRLMNVYPNIKVDEPKIIELLKKYYNDYKNRKKN